MANRSGVTETGTILDRILAQTVVDVDRREAQVPLEEIDRQLEDPPQCASFRSALRRPGLSLIAEIKRASPSRGRFPVEIEPKVVAREYIEGGADAISVLTDEPFFQGSLADMRSVAEVAAAADPAVPVLRKDFIVDRYQIAEARLHGASAVLLIVAALDQRRLEMLMGGAMDYGLDALIEVHDERELEQALAAGASIVGVNNRNLHTFEVDLAVSERLAPRIPDDVLCVGESGIFTPEHASRMADAGLDAILVGESLIVAADRVAAVRRLKCYAEFVDAGD